MGADLRDSRHVSIRLAARFAAVAVLVSVPWLGAESGSAAEKCRVLPAVPPSSVPTAVKEWSGGGPVIGSGAIWTGRIPNRVLDQNPHTEEGPPRLKLGWYLHPARGDVPTITGRRINGSGTLTASAGPAISDGRTWVASTLDFSEPGCWEITAKYQDSTLEFRLRVAA
jgi:hypothetical protein